MIRLHPLAGFRWLSSALAAGAFALAAANTAALEPDKLFEKVSPSVVTVVASRDTEGKSFGFGSGVVIAPQTVITNCHVLEQGKIVVVKIGQQAHPATLEFPDVERDLCQLRVPGLPSPAVEFSSAAALKVGQRVFAIGNPRQLELSLSDGLISSLRDVKAGAPLIQTTAPISPGSSGGGLFDSDGRLIGITSFQRKDSQNLNFANPVDWIHEVPQRGKAALARYASIKATAPAPAPAPAVSYSPAPVSRTPTVAANPNPKAYAAEWSPRIEQLEKARGQLTLAKALTILLDIQSAEELELVQTHAGSVKALSWNSAFAIGADQSGNIIWGGSRNWRNVVFASETAMEFCAGRAGNTCKVVVANGDFQEGSFLELARRLGGQDLAATRRAYMQSLARTPAETRLSNNAGGGGGGPSYGFASLRDQ